MNEVRLKTGYNCKKKARKKKCEQIRGNTVVFWRSIIWLKIFAQIQGSIVVKRAKNLELWRLAEASSGIFFCYSFWKNNAGKKILRCTFLHFGRKSSCHWSILAIFLVANFFGKLLCKNLWYIWLFSKVDKYSDYS